MKVTTKYMRQYPRLDMESLKPIFPKRMTTEAKGVYRGAYAMYLNGKGYMPILNDDCLPDTHSKCLDILDQFYDMKDGLENKRWKQ